MAKTGAERDADRAVPPTHAEDLLGLGPEVAIAVAAGLDASREDEAAGLV